MNKIYWILFPYLILCIQQCHKAQRSKNADFEFFYHINRNNDDVIFNGVHTFIVILIVLWSILCLGQVVLISRFHLSFFFPSLPCQPVPLLWNEELYFLLMFLFQKVDWFYLQMKLTSMTTNFIMKEFSWTSNN